MSKEREVLRKIQLELVGRKLFPDERNLLTKSFNPVQFSVELLNILSDYKLIGQSFSISEEEGHLGFGVEMKWLTPAGQVEDAYNYYPGLLVFEQGYVPIGSCLLGSGDPYFLKIIDQQFKIFRVPHDAISEDIYDYDSIEFICELHELFSYYC